MEAGELQEVEARLREIARMHGLPWLADQVDEVVREGKPEFKRPAARYKRTADEIVPAEITRGRGILASEPYSERERVRLFVQALRRVLADTAAIEEAAAAALLDRGRVASVQFVDEFGAQPNHDLIEDRARSRELLEERKRLVDALAETERRTG
jgi:hypothetical protein